MTVEEIRSLDIEQIENRAAELANVIESAETVGEMDAIQAELTAIEERKAEIRAQIEERKKDVAAVIASASKPIEETTVEERKHENMEFRDTKEYINAYAKYIRTGDARECRAIYTENAAAEGQKIPVPTFVGEIVAARFEESEILRRVRKMYSPGNVRVGFEIYAPAANYHGEGESAVQEEALELGIVDLMNTTLKKWVSVSDEALDSMDGESFLRYLYDEIARGIVKAEEDAVITDILDAQATASATAPAVPKTGTAPFNIADIVNARALLSSAAKDLVVILSPQDYAHYRALQMSAQYAVDPFDGLEVLFSDKALQPIVGDLSGYMINYPKGDNIEYKFDDRTLMTSDMVRVLGRLPVSSGLVGNKYFAKVSA